MQRRHHRRKADSLVSKYRRLPASAAQKDLEDLYTHGCAELLRLETRALRLKRRLIAAEADGPADARAARDAAELRRLWDAVDEELVEVRAVVRLLRTTFDWADFRATSDDVAVEPLQATDAA